ncbi:sodium-dependent nutrient amino acid transporter 1-like isoform X3 [Odontomachus brunneus]|uniref:sodium-dependent nutrient amino acid transporter 1-like isoform X3 n=1 Tax=Odontomachus brunneus TaxID=486640 RepID=UPI0013F22FFF|nr:sodium-dependent nutrient amino acid transporter 1-like isoform X3 [Odontomachus brunneus]
MEKVGTENPGFIGDNGSGERRNSKEILGTNNDGFNFACQMPNDRKLPFSPLEETSTAENEKKRATWGSDTEFLMSCIAMSVGLGNVWRFPFTAYENGGGAFLIPYILVLFVVGKPFYYLEMIMGQFTSSSSVKIWSAVPALRGVGWAQTYSTAAVGTYYCALMSISLLYFVRSFATQLPWSTCLEDWGDSCVDSAKKGNITDNITVVRSSAELYFTDVIIVTTLDTLTSLLAGFTIFGILGNLAYELGTDDISRVVRSGTGLAFISYPDAIAKFSVLPQLFSVLFFLMLFVLGIGSAVALVSSLNIIICDQFPTWKHWHVVIGTAVIGFLAGTLYCTPGGQFMLGLVDFYAGSFIIFFLATLEMSGTFWVYGLENLLDDVEYMLQRRPSVYWRICWAIITPLLLAGILIYTIINLKPLTYSNVPYPSSAHIVGWTLFTFGVLQVPFWMLYTILSKRNLGLPEMFKAAFSPSSKWGPKSPAHMASWREFKEMMNKKREKRNCSRLKQFIYVIFCLEHKLV